MTATPGPWSVERHDQDDGTINYEIWAIDPPAVYHRVVTLSDWDNENAKADAELMVRAVNILRSESVQNPSARRFALLLGVAGDRTVRRWERGDMPVPVSVQLILRAIDEVPGMRKFLAENTQSGL